MTLPLGIVASGYNVPLPVVTGGTLTSDATYYYRTFNANGTLTVSGPTLTADILLVGGGAGGRTTLSDQLGAWQAASGGGMTYIGTGGSGGGVVREYFNVSLTPQPVQGGGGLTGGNFSIVVGAGGGNAGQGGTTSMAFPNGYMSLTSSTGGAANGGGYGGYNDLYSGGNPQTVQLNNGVGGYPPYQPKYGIGAGGAGAGGAGGNANGSLGSSGGTYVTAFNGVRYGAGSGGVGGMYYGGTDYWNVQWGSDYAEVFYAFNGTSPESAGTSSYNGAGGAAPANRGGGGGPGRTSIGFGGSGVVVIRYTRAQVGG